MQNAWDQCDGKKCRLEPACHTHRLHCQARHWHFLPAAHGRHVTTTRGAVRDAGLVWDRSYGLTQILKNLTNLMWGWFIGRCKFESKALFFLQDLNVSLANWMKPCLMRPITEVFIIQFVFRFSHTQRESYSARTKPCHWFPVDQVSLVRIFHAYTTFLSMEMELFDRSGGFSVN